jgi:hypothetical protein
MLLVDRCEFYTHILFAFFMRRGVIGDYFPKENKTVQTLYWNLCPVMQSLNTCGQNSCFEALKGIWNLSKEGMIGHLRGHFTTRCDLFLLTRAVIVSKAPSVPIHMLRHWSLLRYVRLTCSTTGEFSVLFSSSFRLSWQVLLPCSYILVSKLMATVRIEVGAI